MLPGHQRALSTQSEIRHRGGAAGADAGEPPPSADARHGAAAHGGEHGASRSGSDDGSKSPPAPSYEDPYHGGYGRAESRGAEAERAQLRSLTQRAADPRADAPLGGGGAYGSGGAYGGGDAKFGSAAADGEGIAMGHVPLAHAYAVPYPSDYDTAHASGYGGYYGAAAGAVAPSERTPAAGGAAGPYGHGAPQRHDSDDDADDDNDGAGARTRAATARCTRIALCFALALAALLILVLASPPAGAARPVWLSFGLCAQPQAEGDGGASTRWVSLPLDEEEGCPAQPLGAAASARVGREQFPPFGGPFDWAGSTFLVRAMRSSFTAGSLSFRVLDAHGAELLPAAAHALPYLTDRAVACNASSSRLCTQSTEGDIGTDALKQPLYAKDSDEAASADADAELASGGAIDAAEGRRRLSAASASAAARAGRLRAAAAAAAAAAPPPTARRLLKGGSSSHFGGGGSGGGGGTHAAPSHAATPTSSRGWFGGGGGGGVGHASAQSAQSGYISSHLAQGRGAAGSGFAFHATPTQLTQPSALAFGTTFVLLHHGSRGGYQSGWSSQCATDGCAFAAESELAVDDFLDAAFTVHGKDFPLTFELLAATLEQRGVAAAGGEAGAPLPVPLLLFSFEPLPA